MSDRYRITADERNPNNRRIHGPGGQLCKVYGFTPEEAEAKAGQIVAELLREAPPAAWVGECYRLTPAETAVVGALCCGLLAKEIARRDGVSMETTRTHIRRVLAKVGVNSQQRLIVVALRGPAFHPDREERAPCLRS